MSSDGSSGDYAAITVSDTGIGVAHDFLPHLFERFRQADPSSTRAYGGLGLGLAIVRHLVELHGGTVEAHSEGENKGATFTVKLPVAIAHVAHHRPRIRGSSRVKVTYSWQGQSGLALAVSSSLALSTMS